MVASQAVIEHGPDLIVEELSASMEAHAASGEWERVEEIAARLKNAVMQVPEERRRHALVIAQRATAHIEMMARTAHEDVSTRLTAIRRGRNVTRAYEGKD